MYKIVYLTCCKLGPVGKKILKYQPNITMKQVIDQMQKVATGEVILHLPRRTTIISPESPALGNCRAAKSQGRNLSAALIPREHPQVDSLGHARYSQLVGVLPAEIIDEGFFVRF